MRTTTRSPATRSSRSARAGTRAERTGTEDRRDRAIRRGSRQQPSEKRRLLKKEVDSEEIAEVVSQWTGIPVSRMLTTECEKLLRLEEQIHLRMVNQNDAVRRGRRRGAPQPRRTARSQPADRLVPLPGPDGRGQDRAGPGPCGIPLRQRGGHGAHRHERIWRAAQCCPSDRARPGYVGYEEGGRLTEAIRRRPTRLCSWTRSRRLTAMCSMSCSRCSMTGG